VNQEGGGRCTLYSTVPTGSSTGQEGFTLITEKTRGEGGEGQRVVLQFIMFWSPLTTFYLGKRE
jgi:hypothetical protein